MNKWLTALGGLAVLAAGPGYAQQAGPAPGQQPPGQVMQGPGYAPPAAADPTREFAVTSAAGPWMVMVASFRGDPAPQLAHDFVAELRNHYHLSAYVFARGADAKRQEDERVEQEREKQRQWMQSMGFGNEPVHVRRMRIDVEYAILVGGYPDIDAAHKAMDQIRKLPAPPEQFMDRLINATVPQGTGSGTGAPGSTPPAPVLETRYVNPFPNSLVVPNPTVPVARPQRPELDYDELKRFNADECYSLLKCPKRWTLVLREWAGQTVVVSHWTPTEMINRMFGHQSSTYLDAAGMQAHSLAETMHKYMHLEAYVLHMRYGSLLTVGSFDAPNDPELLRMQRQLAGISFQPPGQAVDPNLKMFDVPLPMPVPQPKQ